MKVFVFNPEHDLCLAHKEAHYMPPQSALQFANDCCSLMRFFAEEGDVCIPASRFGEALSTKQTIEAIIPWGWNPTLRASLLQQGAPMELLPTAQQIDKVRCFSDRSLTTSIHNQIASKIAHCTLPPSICTSLEQVLHLCQTYRQAVLKSPLSGSGKGIRPVAFPLSMNEEGWVRNILRQFGHILVEKRYEVVQDFAMLFEINQGKVTFIGYSLFANRGFTYAHNHLLTDSQIQSQLQNLMPTLHLDELQARMMRVLEDCDASIPYLRVGVDMFFCKASDTDEMLINPICELNYRHTMGHLSHEMLRRHPEWVGKQFTIEKPSANHSNYTFSIQ